MVVELLRRTDLAELAVVHHRDAVGEIEGLLLIVRHVKRRDPEPLEKAAELRAGPFAEGRIEVGEGLVEEEEGWFDRQCPSQCDTLLLTAGKLLHPPVHVADKVNAGERRVDEPSELARLRAPGLESERDVLEHGKVWEERVALEDHPEAAFLGRPSGHVRSPEEYPAGVRRLEAGDQPKSRRFAAAAGPQQRHQLAGLELQGEVAYGLHLPEPLPQAVQLEAHPPQLSAHSASLLGLGRGPGSHDPSAGATRPRSPR